MDNNKSKICVPLSVNDIGKIQFAIRSEELDHWTYALRVAWLGFLEKKSVIEPAQEHIKARLSRIKRLKSWIFFWKRKQVNQEIEEIENELIMLEAQVRDAINEQNAFKSEVDRLNKTYNTANLSYEEIQEKYSKEAIANKIMNLAAINLWAATHNLPESVARQFFVVRALDPQLQKTFVGSVTKKCMDIDLMLDQPPFPDKELTADPHTIFANSLMESNIFDNINNKGLNS